jgi:predicted enzyme related to lactoylglutathione lyase
MMRLAQCRIVTGDVQALAGFYARLIGVPVTLNDYYVEVPAGAASIGFSKPRFTEYPQPHAQLATSDQPAGGELVLDFQVDDVDAHYARIDALGVTWVTAPATQPWGARSMVLRDPEGHLVNVFSRPTPEEH